MKDATIMDTKKEVIKLGLKSGLVYACLLMAAAVGHGFAVESAAQAPSGLEWRLPYAAANLVCTQVLYGKNDSKDESWKKSRIIESFNLPGSHAVIIANPDGKRVGELSTAPQSIEAFVQDIINQKESRPQDKPKPFTELPAEEQAEILKWYPELQNLK